jgi:hypothetical protein
MVFDILNDAGLHLLSFTPFRLEKELAGVVDLPGISFGPLEVGRVIDNYFEGLGCLYNFCMRGTELFR